MPCETTPIQRLTQFVIRRLLRRTPSEIHAINPPNVQRIAWRKRANALQMRLKNQGREPRKTSKIKTLINKSGL